jgi:ERCC4-type nuclease
MHQHTVNIVMDSRESDSYVHQHLSGMDVNIIRKQLDTGDYVCSERVALERKTVSDFLNSVTDQRIFKQMNDLKSIYERPVLIIEGNPEKLFEANIHPNTVRGSLASIAIDYGIPIIWTRHARETANQIYWIGYREQLKDRKELAIRPNKKAGELAKQQEYLIAGLPFVNSTLSRRLLEKFKTPKKVFSASEERLMKVEGIGRDKARKIREILDGEY